MEKFKGLDFNNDDDNTYPSSHVYNGNNAASISNSSSRKSNSHQHHVQNHSSHHFINPSHSNGSNTPFIASASQISTYPAHQGYTENGNNESNRSHSTNEFIMNLLSSSKRGKVSMALDICTEKLNQLYLMQGTQSEIISWTASLAEAHIRIGNFCFHDKLYEPFILNYEKGLLLLSEALNRNASTNQTEATFQANKNGLELAKDFFTASYKQLDLKMTKAMQKKKENLELLNKGREEAMRVMGPDRWKKNKTKSQAAIERETVIRELKILERTYKEFTTFRTKYPSAFKKNAQANFNEANDSYSLRYFLVDTVEDLNDCLRKLRQYYHIAFDCEGQNLSRSGELTIACFLGYDSNTFEADTVAYVVDIQTLGEQAFAKGLKYLLENRKQVKLMYDCRADADALLHQFNVELKSVIDVQILEQACRQFDLRKFL